MAFFLFKFHLQAPEGYSFNVFLVMHSMSYDLSLLNTGKVVKMK